MNNPFAMLGFFSIFELIGGIAIGAALRGMKNGLSGKAFFLLVWGGMFAGIPLFMGAGVFVSSGLEWFFAAQLAVGIGTILGALFIPAGMIETMKSPSVMLIGFGGIFLLFGVGFALAMFRTELIGALVMACIFGGVGGMIFLMGLKSLLKGKE